MQSSCVYVVAETNFENHFWENISKNFSYFLNCTSGYTNPAVKVHTFSFFLIGIGDFAIILAEQIYSDFTIIKFYEKPINLQL